MEQTVASDLGIDDNRDEDGHQQGDEPPLVLLDVLFQRFEVSESRDEQQRDDEPNHHQLDDEQNDDENLERILPTRVGRLLRMASLEQR